jgi:uncharacterized metal-binding protein YceD (DUF177 family)
MYLKISLQILLLCSFFTIFAAFFRKRSLGKFDPYKIDLKNMKEEVLMYDYLLDNKFFIDIDGAEFQKGKVKVHLTVEKMSMMFELNFEINGIAVVPCDRCLDDMDLPVTTQNRLIVKFGKDFSEESDEVVVIPENEGVINLAWFMYEFIALSLPIKHVHAPGKCNKLMSSKLRKHSVKSEVDEEYFVTDEGDDIIISDGDSSDNETDPRWDVLKGLVEK